MFSTTTQGDDVKSGQDFDTKVGDADNVLGKKRLSQRARTVRNIPILAFPEMEDGTLGPETGWHLYEPTAIGNNPPVWSEAFPVSSRVKPGGGALEYRLVGPEKWEDADERWTVPDAALPDDNLYPGGWVFASLRTTEENAQNVALLPGFVGLVAPHQAGDEDYGTAVYDLTPDNALDRDRKAPLQSLCRVYAYPDSQCVSFGDAGDFGIALQLGDARKDRAGFGMVADFPTAGAAASPVGAGPVVARGAINQVLAALSVNSGGFIDVGDGTDIHQLGVNADGEACNGAHIAEVANYRGPTGDAPKEYDPTPYIPPATPPYLVPTFHRLDKTATHNWKCGQRPGLRKWESLSYFRIKDGDEPPPLDDPLPPDGSERVFVTGRTRKELDLALTDLEMGMVGIVGVPQHHGPNKRDLRNATSSRGGREAFRLARDRGELRRPAVGRMEWGGKQRGSGWDLTNPPGASVYRDGDAQGFAAFMPSNYSLGYAAPATNPGMEVLLWDSGLSFGTPDLELGGVKSGFRIRRDSTTGHLVFARVADDGSATDSMTLTDSDQLEVPFAVFDDYLEHGGGSSPEAGFFGATPVTQPGAITNPSGGAIIDSQARTAIIAILGALRTLGLIAT